MAELPVMTRGAGGWAAKLGPCDLDELVKQLSFAGHPDLLVGPEHGSDAGVYRVSDEVAIVQSADFFPPLVADARDFGRIAAANSLSDIYAMGGRPVTALNLLATPKDTPQASLVAMLDGARELVEEAGAVVVGGHTIVGNTVMFGLSATGVVHPGRLLRNTTAQAGDVLVLTKPLGSGVVVHAFNAGQAGDAELAEAVGVMTTLNRLAGQALYDCGAHASTDITGFGLLGHALDMLALGQVGFEIDYPAVPLLERAEELALAGNYPGGSKRNGEYTEPRVKYTGDCTAARMLLNDAQTSGGLLIALPEDGAQRLLDLLNEAEYPCDAAVIGRVATTGLGTITVNCS